MNEPPDRGLPYCPNCGADLVRANRPADGAGFDFERITARCAACDCVLRIRMRPVGMQLVDDSLGETAVAFVGPGERGFTTAAVAQWQRLPNRIRWLVACYAIMLFSPYFVNEYRPRGDSWLLFTFAPHFALASLLGLWAASGPRLSLERLFMAVFAAVVLGAFVRWCLDEALDAMVYWFTPATVTAFAVFAAFAWLGWRIRKVPASEQLSPAASLQFSVRQLMILTAVIVIQLLGLVALYAIDEWQSEAVIIVLGWSFFGYFLLLSVPLLALRSCGFRFTRTVTPTIGKMSREIAARPV